MARYTGPKCRKCRRYGVSLCGKARCALTRATGRLRSERMTESRRGAEDLLAAIRAKDASAASAAAIGHLERASALAIAAMHPDEEPFNAKLA